MAPSAWQMLTEVDAWQVTQIPRRPQQRHQVSTPQDEGDLLTAQRVTALGAAYHRGTGPVAFAWVRERAAGPVRVLAAGGALAASSDGSQTLLKVPAGARGEEMPAGEFAQVLAGMPHWVRIAGVADSLLAQEQQPDVPGHAIRPSLEDGLLAAWPGPFAWLVLADPIGRGELNELTLAVAVEQLKAMKFDDPKNQLKAERLGARHAELRRGQSIGMWRICMLAGGETEQDAAEVAGLLCCSADLEGLPYGLSPEPAGASLDKILGQPGTGAGGRPPDVMPAGDDYGFPPPASPFDGSSRLLAALARAPAREVPGVQFVLRPEFDTTPETVHAGTGYHNNPGAAAEPVVELGTLLDRNRMPAGELLLPLASLNRHGGVFGATGAGKSQTVRALLEQATAKAIPWLVVEPAKSEYSRGMAARLPAAEVIRIRPGEADQAAAGINPLEPAPWADGSCFPLQTHADLVKSLFLAAFEADEPFPQVLNAALTRVYEQAGWDLVLGEPKVPGTSPAYPSLGDLQAVADQVVLDIGYGPEVERNVRGFITVRLGSLRLGTPGRFFEGGHPLDFGKLLGTNVVLEIEDVGDDQDKAFLIGTVLIRLAEHLRLGERHTGREPTRLRHLTVIEEAHRLLRNPQPGQQGPAAKAVEMFAALFAEVRAYGEGLIVAEQIPAKLLPDVVKNTAVKIVHRLPADDDRQSVGATMNLTEEQSQYLVTLPPGEAAVFADGADYPWLVRMPDGTSRETGNTAKTASPASILAPRSVSCSPSCEQSPCTLRQMRAAQRAAETDPRITLWAELSVLAHLTGWTMPMLEREFAAALRAMDARLRECALSHAVDAAVAARASGPVLAGHITAAMRAAVDDHYWLCEWAEPAYLAPPYRWALVLDSLKTHHRSHSDGGRHPRSSEWEATYGQPIPGDSCARQLGTVQRWYDSDQRNHRQLHAIAYGTRTPAAIEQAIGARISDDDWEQRLTDALAAFRDCRWPADYLRPATTGPGT